MRVEKCTMPDGHGAAIQISQSKRCMHAIVRAMAAVACTFPKCPNWASSSVSANFPEAPRVQILHKPLASSTNLQCTRRFDHHKIKAMEKSVVESVEESEFSSHHPLDPHKPSFSPLLPEKIRPYPSFEGWYTRVVDVSGQFSAGVIMATNYATEESQVTLLFSTSPHSTKAVAAKTKNAKFTSFAAEDGSNGEVGGSEPQGFQWEAEGLGKIVMKPHESELEVNVQGYQFKAQMDHEVSWDPKHTEKGPEGWVAKVPLFPCHWYVYSLGSRANYTFTGPELKEPLSGSGFAHQEKNWGETFPSGHVWLQGLTADNSSQLVCSGAYFKIGKELATPFVFALGYRSPNHQVNMRTNDVGTIFKDMQVSPLDGQFSLTGVSASYTIKISSTAPPKSFSEQVLAPIGKLEWKPACRESFVATMEVELYEHTAWGVASEDKLVDKQVFKCAALEFGEDLLQSAMDKKQQKS